MTVDYEVKRPDRDSLVIVLTFDTPAISSVDDLRDAVQVVIGSVLATLSDADVASALATAFQAFAEEEPCSQP